MTTQTLTSWIEQVDELTTVLVNRPDADIHWINVLISDYAPAVWDAIEQGMTIADLRGADDEGVYEAQCETLAWQLREYLDDLDA